MKEEDLNFEIGFFEDLIRDDPDFIDALVPLADAYTKKGLYQKGLDVDVRLAGLRPWDPIVFYNLACSYSLLGEKKKTLEALGKALKLGYRDLAWMEEDNDLDGIRKSKAYRDLIQKYFPSPPKQTDKK